MTAGMSCRSPTPAELAQVITGWLRSACDRGATQGAHSLCRDHERSLQ